MQQHLGPAAESIKPREQGPLFTLGLCLMAGLMGECGAQGKLRGVAAGASARGRLRERPPLHTWPVRLMAGLMGECGAGYKLHAADGKLGGGCRGEQGRERGPLFTLGLCT